MWPLFFELGPLKVRTYGVLVALGFLAALHLAKILGRRRGIPDAFVMDLGALCIGTGLLGARALYVLLNFDFFRAHPLDVFKVWEGGLVFYGGFIAAALAAAWWVSRKSYSLAVVADIVAPALAVGQAIGRLGCFAAGCCYGQPSTLPWACAFHSPEALAPLGIALHPTQIYESLGNLLLAAGLVVWTQKGKPAAGMVFWTYLLGYGILRYSVELVRGDDRGIVLAGLYPSQWIAVVAVLLSATVLAVRFASDRHGHS